MQSMQDFVPEVNRRLRARGLHTDNVVSICRSGDRSRRGANRRADDGFGRVYSVAVGLEGDSSAVGPRALNSWRNASLPWSYRRGNAGMYFPR